MSESRQLIAPVTGISKIALVALAVVFLAGLFVVAFDQGHILSLVYGEQAFADQFFHELAHDVRHASGFPCH
ncbi:MAG: CbtB-domain containing protein [Nitrosopumilus sp. H13]|nr:MAG: CbtB-domain containing protein [Nitrosopumilus sp. H13]